MGWGKEKGGQIKSFAKYRMKILPNVLFKNLSIYTHSKLIFFIWLCSFFSHTCSFEIQLYESQVICFHLREPQINGIMFLLKTSFTHTFTCMTTLVPSRRLLRFILFRAWLAKRFLRSSWFFTYFWIFNYGKIYKRFIFFSFPWKIQENDD